MSEEKNIIIYNTADGKASVSLFAKDGSVWMNQNQLAELFDTTKQNIGQHITNILNDRKLNEMSVVKNYFTTASDGKKYNAGFISNKQMESKIQKVYTEFEKWRKKIDAIEADKQDFEELKNLEEKIKKHGQ